MRSRKGENTKEVMVSYHEFKLVDVFELAALILDLFGKYQARLEQEHMAIFDLLDQLFRVPYLEFVL